MSGSMFEQVTSSLTALSICGSLGPDIPAGTDLFELENLLGPAEDPNRDAWNDPSRVMDSNGNLVGILSFGDYAVEEEGMVDDVMERPEPWQFLSSGTTIIEAVQLVANTSNGDFYILHGNQVVGYLSYRHLFHPVGRLALLALALEIEEQALRLCQHPPFREEAWKSLPENRRNKALNVFRERHGGESKQPIDIDRLIDCTTLTDKAKIIWKNRLVSTVSSRSLLGFFHGLGKIRNFCAHPQRSGSGDELMPKQELSRFINDTKSMKNTLNEALLNHRVTRWHQSYQIVF